MVYAKIPQGLGTPGTSKSMNRIGAASLALNSHFSIFVHRVLYLKIFLDYASNRSSFSRLNLITRNKGARPQHPPSSASEKYIFLENKNLLPNS